MSMTLCLVAGARPNFTKIAPLMRALHAHGERISTRLVHTGQHYDHQMSDVFFSELGIPAPDVALGCGGGTHAEQTARIMIAFEQYLQQERPDWVVVVGDVNSTLACAIVARKLHIRVAHVEAGLRSRDQSMPEEINRIVTDSIANLFFTTEPAGDANLLIEGHDRTSIHFVGNLMIDNLLYQLDRMRTIPEDQLDPDGYRARLLALGQGRYGAVTLHRPANVDDPACLSSLMNGINQLAAELPLVFPIHPRTRKALERSKITLHPNIVATPPLSYLHFLYLWRQAAVVVTDSGGLQEETTAVGVRCVTARDSTERPITITRGSNILAGVDGESVLRHARNAQTLGPSDDWPDLWDGRAAERIASVFLNLS